MVRTVTLARDLRPNRAFTTDMRITTLDRLLDGLMALSVICVLILSFLA